MNILISTHKKRTSRIFVQSAACVLVLFYMVSVIATLNSAHAIAHAITGFQNEQKPEKSQPGNAQEKSEQVKRGTAVLWQEPTDIESRDLFYGIGGQEGAPDPEGKFTFLADKGSPKDSNPKIDVKDEKGRTWTVKFGPEVKSETTATRIVWAVGYHVDENYFVDKAKIDGFTRLETRDLRFERDDDDWKTLGRWDWEDNPFLGTRELDGLKTLMALIHNVDLSELNNKIVRPKKLKDGGAEKSVHYVNDLGASLGSTGAWFTSLPLLTKARSESKGDPEDYVKNGFIAGVKDGEVKFKVKRRQAEKILSGVKVEHAQWMGNLLARLSEKQLIDAFRAGGFTDSEVNIYVVEIRSRIAQLQKLDLGASSAR